MLGGGEREREREGCFGGSGWWPQENKVEAEFCQVIKGEIRQGKRQR